MAVMSIEADTPASADRVLDALADRVERALVRLARLDPASAATLERLHGRELRLSLRGAVRGLRLRIAEGRVRPVPDAGGEADLALSIEASAVLAWLARPGVDRGLPPGLRIDGELEMARVLEQALRDFDPDWEQPFADLLGTTLGPQFARGLGSALSWARGQAQAFAASSAEFAVEEARLVAARAELDEFNAEVDRLRDDVERLSARIERVGRDGGSQ